LRQEVVSRSGQRNSARRTFNQLDPEVSLEILQPSRYGSLGNMELVRRSLKAAVVGN
jgi:hypothetical protein